MSEDWPDCIVTLIDVIGIKSAAKRGSKASGQMRNLHSLAQTSMNLGMPKHAHSYCWNDSVLLLAFWNGEPADGRGILSEASALKRRIDETIGQSYAISVKGRAFPDHTPPPPAVYDGANHHPRCVVLKASSYAMANCYLTEAEAKKQKCRADWYIDVRLKKVLGQRLTESFAVEMLPTGKSRKVYLLSGYIE
jgi:hypothetical protein